MTDIASFNVGLLRIHCDADDSHTVEEVPFVWRNGRPWPWPQGAPENVVLITAEGEVIEMPADVPLRNLTGITPGGRTRVRLHCEVCQHAGRPSDPVVLKWGKFRAVFEAIVVGAPKSTDVPLNALNAVASAISRGLAH